MSAARQIERFQELSRQRWLYRLALGQPHQQDFIESVSRLPDDGRHEFRHGDEGTGVEVVSAVRQALQKNGIKLATLPEMSFE